MKRTSAFLAVLLLIPPEPSYPSSTPNQTLLVLTHVAVIDVAGTQLNPDMTIVVSGTRIAEIGATKTVRIPPGAEVVDAEGKFLIPGLWDMHVHWYAKEYLPLFLANGVTGIRLMFGMPMHLQWRQEIEAGQLVGPRMAIASPIIDGPKPFWPDSIAVATEAEGRSAVRRVKQNGADFVKVYTFLPRDAYFGVADEARKLGIPFEGHVPLSVTAEEASRAGQKSLEHLLGVLPACSLRSDDLDKAARADLLEDIETGKPVFEGPNYNKIRNLELKTFSSEKANALFLTFARNHTWQCPTLTTNRNVAYANDPSLRRDPRLKYIPRRLKASWERSFEPEADSGYLPVTAEDFAFYQEEFRKQLEVVGVMEKSGVGILAGTDAMVPFAFPGFSLHDELALLVQAGLTPGEALQTVTLNPARFLGKERDLGTIEKDRIADLVLLDANPLEDISNTKEIAGVVFDGRYLSKSSLDEMLAKIEVLAAKKSIADELFLTLIEKGVDVAIERYRHLRKTSSDDYDFGEGELDDLGFRLLGQKKPDEAIRILELNAEVHAQSWYVYDSLGEIYMRTGHRVRAIGNFRKSLKLNPANWNAADKLKQLSRN